MAIQHEAEPEASKMLQSESAGADADAAEGKPGSPIAAEAATAVEKDLPVVEAPKLDASEVVTSLLAKATNEVPKIPADESTGKASSPPVSARSLRFAPLAASVALAAALGSMVGSLSASGLVHLWPGAAAKSKAAEANALQATKIELAELSALKSNFEGATRSANGQFAKLGDRLDRVEHAQLDPAAKLAHIAEAIDRLEKKMAAASVAAPDTTGSVTSNPSAAPTDAKLTDRVLQDWIVQDVRGGRVLVASRYGGIFPVATGSFLPGLGRVETIKRQDGQWVVVTARGLITQR
jgi:hypothetical protein